MDVRFGSKADMCSAKGDVRFTPLSLLLLPGRRRHQAQTTATARWALLFIVRAFFNDTVTVAVWTGFHACPGCYHTDAILFAGASLIRLRPKAGNIVWSRSV